MRLVAAFASCAREWLVVPFLVTFLNLGCDQPAPPAREAHAAVQRTASARGTLTTQAASTAPGAKVLRDYVVHPLISPGEEHSRPLRIISAAPNLTEICCALGLRDQLVGRTRYCDYPPGIEAVPSIGALVDTNVEVILALKPDLILVSGTSRSLTDRLAPLGLRFESVPDISIDDLASAITRIGEWTDRPKTARGLCEMIAADMNDVAARHDGGPAARVLVVTGTLATPPSPPFVAGPGSFYEALLQRVGHRCTAAKGERAFGPLSIEAILRDDPDVIVELDPDGRTRPGGDADALRAWAQVGDLAAVRTKRVHVLRGPQHYLIGPRIAETFEALCAAVEAGTR